MARLSESIRIVPARAGHREFVRGLSAEVFARYGDYGRILPRMMRLARVLTAVAEADGQPVGFAIYSLEGLRRGEVDLAAIAVEPEWQSRGVGRALLDHVEREALRLVPLELATAAVRLTVAEDNDRARQVFAAAGFRPEPGDGGTYPAGQRSLSMRKVIRRSRLDSDLSGAKLE